MPAIGILKLKKIESFLWFIRHTHEQTDNDSTTQPHPALGRMLQHKCLRSRWWWENVRGKCLVSTRSICLHNLKVCPVACLLDQPPETLQCRQLHDALPLDTCHKPRDLLIDCGEGLIDCGEGACSLTLVKRRPWMLRCSAAKQVSCGHPDVAGRPSCRAVAPCMVDCEVMLEESILHL